MKDNEHISIDLSALVKELENQVGRTLILHAVEDDKEKAFIKNTLDVFYKHGIGTMAAMDILQDLTKVLPKKQEGEDGKDTAVY